MFPGAMPQQANKKERQLIKYYKKLEADEQKSLLAFAEFLASRANASSENVKAEADKDNKKTPSQPLSIPRPEEESVIKAIKRLSATYPMVDKENILHPISALMSSHIMQGREATAVIDELEELFLNEFKKLNNNQKDKD